MEGYVDSQPPRLSAYVSREVDKTMLEAVVISDLPHEPPTLASTGPLAQILEERTYMCTATPRLPCFVHGNPPIAYVLVF